MRAEIAKLMVAAIMAELRDKQHVAVGANSPIPATAALLAQHHEPALRVSILGSQEDNPFTDGGRELFDCAAQGRIDTFFFSGVQIDQTGNVNLLGIGQPPRMKRRFVGNFGAPYLAGLIPNIILFRTDHSPRALVERVDFISAPGQHVRMLVTDRATFRKKNGLFELVSLHPGQSIGELQAQTGFPIIGEATTTTTLSSEDEFVLRHSIMPRMRRLYPAFAALLAG